MKINLVRFKSNGEQRVFRVKGDRCLIGRQATCDLVIPMSSVSREHCELIVGEEAILLRDLGSRNGVFRNEEQVEGSVELEPGDRIAVGTIVFTAQIDGMPEQVEPPLMEAPTIATSAKPNSHAQTQTQPKAHSEKDDDPEDSAVDLADLIAQVESDDSSVFDLDLYLDEEDE